MALKWRSIAARAAQNPGACLQVSLRKTPVLLRKTPVLRQKGLVLVLGLAQMSKTRRTPPSEAVAAAANSRPECLWPGRRVRVRALFLVVSVGGWFEIRVWWARARNELVVGFGASRGPTDDSTSTRANRSNATTWHMPSRRTSSIR